MKRIFLVVLCILFVSTNCYAAGSKIRSAPQGQRTETTIVGTDAIPIAPAAGGSYYSTVQDIWDFFRVAPGAIGATTPAAATFTTVTAASYQSSAADGAHSVDVNNTVALTGGSIGKYSSLNGVPQFYDTAWRTILMSTDLAAASDINTGTSTSKAVTPDALAGSDLGAQHVCWIVKQSDIVTAVADGKDAFVVPAAMNGMNLTDLTCSVSDLNSASGGSTDVVVRRVRGATAADMTSTACTISYDAYTASDETVDTSNDDLATGDKIFVDVNAVTTGAVQKGLSCTATFMKP